MSETAPVINWILPRDRPVEVIVTDLVPAGKLFPSDKSKAPDGQIRCHMFKGQYADFPHPVSLQWCNSSQTVTEFKNGDRILIQGGNYNNDALIQSVKWLKTAPRENQRAKMEAIVNGAPPAEIPKGERRVPENSNPSVMGSLWSIAMGHAINYYKDRKDATEDKVLDFAQRLHEDYHKVML